MDYLSRARQRAQRRQSPWNLLLALFCVMGVGGTWVGIAHLLREYRRLFLTPPDAFLFSGTRIGNILAFVTPIFPSLAIGLIVGNSLIWCIPAARAALDREAAGEKGTSFQSSQLALAKLGAFAIAIGLPLSFVGANNFWALTPNRIDYRPMLSASTQHYDWSNVESIETGCSTGKSTSYHFLVTLNGGIRIDLMEESPREFSIAYPRVQSALEGHSYRFSSSGLVGRCVTSAPPRWLELLSKRPTK